MAAAVHRNTNSMQQDPSSSEQTGAGHSGKSQRQACIGCHACPVKLRRCTQQYLCYRCRQAPEYKILSSTQLHNRFALSDDLVDDLQIGWIMNSVHPSFARQRVYFEKDVLKRIAAASSVSHTSISTLQEIRNQDAAYTSSAGEGTEVQKDTR